MKKTLFIVLIAWLISPVGSIAQKVYMDNGIILDLTIEAGMPAEAVNNTMKYVNGSYSAVNNTSYLVDQSYSDAQNMKLYRKLEIAPENLNSSGALSGSGDSNIRWNSAFTFCKSLSYNGTGWRLPTQRELQLIYIFRLAIDTLSGFNSYGLGVFWSATESDASNVYRVNFGSSSNHAVTTTGGKNSNNGRVRCVREIAN